MGLYKVRLEAMNMRGSGQAELGRKAGGSPRRTLGTRLSLELQRELLRPGEPGVSRPGMCL